MIEKKLLKIVMKMMVIKKDEAASYIEGDEEEYIHI